MKRTKQQIEDKFEMFCRAMGENRLCAWAQEPDDEMAFPPDVPGFFLFFDSDTKPRRYVVRRWDGCEKQNLSRILPASQIWDWMDAAIIAVNWYKNH